MSNSELDKLVAELRFMQVSIVDIYDRVQLHEGAITGLNLDGVGLGNFPHFPVTILKLQQLQKLSLRYNNLRSIPRDLVNLSSLNYLDLGHNNLGENSLNLVDLNEVRELRLGDNGFKSRVIQQSTFPNFLQRLHLGNNLLEEIPSLSHLSHLKSISLPENFISTIKIDNLPESVKYLNLRANQLSSLPEKLWNFDNLQKLNIYHNTIEKYQITDEFDGIVFVDRRLHGKDDRVRILKQKFHDLRFLPNHPPQFGITLLGIPFTSIMVFGDKNTGKQSFIETYLEQHFLPPNHLTIFQNRYMNWDHYIFYHNQRNFQIWYPFLQEFHNPDYRRSILNGFYYAGIIVLFFDISQSMSFQTVEQSVNRITAFRSRNTPIIIVGNKMDKQSSQILTKDKIQRKLEVLRAYSGRRLKYFEISVKTGKGVDTVFNYIFSLFE